MASNNRVPIAIVQPSAQWLNGAVAGPTANTNQDGTSSSTSSYLVAQARDAVPTDRDMWGSYILLKPAGSPAATVARFWLYTGSSGTFTMGTSNTAANTFPLGELSLPSITSTQIGATPDFIKPLNFIVPAGNRILVSFGTSTGAAGTGYVCTFFGGFY
jgi:hypothetical protein